MKDGTLKIKKDSDSIDLRTDVISVYASFQAEFIKKGQHCLELCGYGTTTTSADTEQLWFLAAYDANSMTRWLDYLSKAKKFAEWYSRI